MVLYTNTVMTIERKPVTKREISAGIIVYKKTEEGLKFLILYHGHNYWNFPKGKIESEEKSLEAALRETREETELSNRNLKLVQNFKAYERFYFRRAGQPVYKIVIFYLAETDATEIAISHEHNGYAWFSFNEAKRILGKYRDSQRVLKQVCDFLKKPEQKGDREQALHNNEQKHAELRRRSTRTYRPSSPWEGNSIRRNR
ncbi:MAG: NUDIX domain-containing protein [Candidatus Liptonbacteria bacterium]